MNTKREWKLHIPGEGVSFSAMCSHLEGSLYRLESIPFAAETIAYGDTFEGEDIGDKLRVRWVVERAGRRNYSFILTQASCESAHLKSILATVGQQGGVWEQAFGGVLAISLPPGAEYDPTADVLACSR
ncbi:MAG: DUF4265 domain-containing protein [Tepidisphaeraceae bacterium]|jgi:hypothetical protein